MSEETRSWKIVARVSLLSIIIGISVIALIVLTIISIDKSIKIEVDDSEVDLPVGTAYKAPEVHGMALNKEKEVTISGEVNPNKIGTYEIHYSIKCLFWRKSKTKIVKVFDNTPPVITLKADKEISIYEDVNYNDPGATATDNYDGDLTDKIKTSGNVNSKVQGDYTINFEVTDSSGNVSKANRLIHVVTRPEELNSETDDYNNYYGKIYLTFDDGPSTLTSDFLDLLKKYNAKATFFVTCNGPDEMIKRAYDEGHTIGLHTASHKYSIYSSEDTYFDDLAKVDDRVYNVIGIHSKIIRFPGGSSNTVSKKYKEGIMTKLANDVESRGYQYWDWNITSGDAGDTTDPNKIVQNVTSECKKDKKNVVLMHDIHKYTREALEPILKWGTENGYKFEAIENSMKPVHHALNN